MRRQAANLSNFARKMDEKWSFFSEKTKRKMVDLKRKARSGQMVSDG
jgi:hypothetical protein